MLYLFSMIFYIFVLFLRNTTFNPFIGSRPFNISSYLVTLLLGFKIFFLDVASKKEKFVAFIILLLAVISWRNSNSNLIIVMVSFILAAKGISFRKIIICYFRTTLIILGFVIFFSLIGVIRDLVFVVAGRAVRYSLGIIYPTDLAAHVLYLVLAHEYLYFKKLNYKYYLSYLLIAIITKIVTDARLSVICMVVSIPVILIARFAEKGNHRRLSVLITTYWIYIPILAFSAVTATYFFDRENHIFFKIDRMLSGRLGYGHLAMGLYPITWFGQKIIEHGLGGGSGLAIFRNHNNGYFFIDSSYIRLVMIYGLVITFIVIGIMVIISIRGIRQYDFALTAVLLVVTLSCLVEQHLLELSFNPFLLALLADLGKKSEVLKNES